MNIKIQDREIGEGKRPFIIAEIGQNHDGSLGMAHAYIEAVSKTGADAIKFQTHIACKESHPLDEFRVKFSYQDASRYDYWKRMEFSKKDWIGLYEHAMDNGLIFLSSPFSIDAAKLLEEIGIPAWKIGSGEVTNSLLMDFFGETKKPILLSSGMSSFEEIDNAVKHINNLGNPFALFQCTSMYPTPLDKIGLNVITQFKERYNCLVGLSDHSGLIFPSIFAFTKGASLIEVHVTFHKDMFGPDIKSSITMAELKTIVEISKLYQILENSNVDKNEIADELKEMKRLFQKSIAASQNIPKDTILTQDMLKFIKPANGIPVNELDNILGKKAIKDINENDFIQKEDIE